jgi:hypothetical protein
METNLVDLIQARGIKIGETGVEVIAANIGLLCVAGDLGKRKQERQQ